jgi:hypothetical protein
LLRGLIALGDSITNGEGEAMLGVPCRSWALWLAQALELPYTNLARDGATVAQLRAEQLPRVRDRYELGCLYIGVNDVRDPAFDLAGYTHELKAVVAQLAAHAECLLLVTIPLDLGRPRSGERKVAGANEVIRRLAGEHGACVVELTDLSGARMVLPDAVHPTALGQLEIADRAATALGGAATVPSAMRETQRGRRARVRFAVRWSRLLASDLWRRARERVRSI